MLTKTMIEKISIRDFIPRVKKWTGRDLNPRSLDCESNVRTTLNHQPFNTFYGLPVVILLPHLLQ